MKLDFLKDGAEIVAKTSGICPLCSSFIAKNHSKIKRLPHPLAPRGDGQRSFDDGGVYHSGGNVARGASSKKYWAHARCADRYVDRMRAGRENAPLWTS